VTPSAKLKQLYDERVAELEWLLVDAQTAATEESAKKVTAEMKLVVAQTLLRQAVETWDGGDFYDVLWGDWIDEAREVCGAWITMRDM
jgi:hypothetical protein